MLWETVAAQEKNETAVSPGRKGPGESVHLYSVINLRLKMDTNTTLCISRGVDVSMYTHEHTHGAEPFHRLYITCTMCQTYGKRVHTAICIYMNPLKH